MKSGGKQAGGIPVVNITQHPLSPRDLSVIRGKAPEGATKMIVEETRHEAGDHHALALKYMTGKGTFLFCAAAGGDFSQVLDSLKSCKKEK